MFLVQRLWLWLCLMTLTLGSVGVAAQPLTAAAKPAFSWCTRLPAGASVQEAQRCDWQDQIGFLEKIAAPSVWLRVDIGSSTAIDRLEVGPHAVASVTLFEETSTGWRVLRTGQRVPDAADHALQGYLLSLVRERQASPVYLRFDRPVFPSFWVKVGSSGQASLLPASYGLLIHLGILVGLVVLASAMALLRPGPVSWRLAALMAMVCLSVMLGSGLLHGPIQTIHPGLAAPLQHLVLLVRVALWVDLIRVLLQPWNTDTSLRRWFIASHAVILLAASMSIAGTQGFALAVTVLVPLLLPLVLWRYVRSARSMPGRLRWALWIDFVVLQLSVLGLFVATVWSPPQSSWVIAITRVADLSTTAALLLAVAVQDRALTRQLERARRAVAEAQWQARYERRLQKERRLIDDMIHHDLANAASTLRLAVKNLQGDIDPSSPSIARRLESIAAGTRTIEAVLNRYTPDIDESAARADDESWLRLVPVQLDALIGQLLHRHPHAERIHFENALPEARVFSDPQLLTIVLSNLVANAIKYSPPDSQVEVRLHAPQTDDPGDAGQGRGRLGISVVNRLPPGLVLDERSVFSPAWRHPAHEQIDGQGMGLYLVQKLSRLLGASVQLRPEADRAHFLVEVPR